MKIGTRQLAVAALAILILMAGRVWAQEEEQAKTPQQVVTEFADALAVYTFVYYFSGKEFPRELLSDDSQKVMYELYEEAVEPLMAWLAFPRLMPVADISPEGDAVVVVATPQPRPVSVVLVRERGHWKVDLLATLDKLPEPFRPDVESMRQQLDELESEGPVIEITLSNFKEQVLEAEIPVLVEFWSRDGAGRGWDDFRLAFDELARDYAGTVRFGSVDANRNIPLTIAFEVVNIPCLVLFDGGEELARTVGYVSKQELQDWIEQNLATEH